MKNQVNGIFFKSLKNFCSLYDENFENYDIEKAYDFCKFVTKSHYENFPVGSFLIPEYQRRFLFSIYAFSRLADDIADSINLDLDIKERRFLLEVLESNIKSLLNTIMINNPIFLALKDTIERKELPLEPFLKLITAFKMDLSFAQPKNWEDLENYCKYSANPVGELVLRIFGECSERNLRLSDKVCTGLQLANFWQDLSIDIPNGRIYIPEEILGRFELNSEKMLTQEDKEKKEICLNYLIERTKEYLLDGWQLVLFLQNKRLKLELSAIINAGLKILEKERRQGIHLFFKRPKLNFFDYLSVIFRMFVL